MSFNSLLVHTVGIRAYVAGSADRYGNPTSSYAAAVTTPARVEQIVGGFHQPKELLGDRDTALTWFRVFLPATVAIGPLDRIEWGARTFEVDGVPAVHYASTSDIHHITAIAKEIDE